MCPDQPGTLLITGGFPAQARASFKLASLFPDNTPRNSLPLTEFNASCYFQSP